jgi:hypothetical protein
VTSTLVLVTHRGGSVLGGSGDAVGAAVGVATDWLAVTTAVGVGLGEAGTVGLGPQPASKATAASTRRMRTDTVLGGQL